MTAVAPAGEVEYGGEDLEILASLFRYRRWIMDGMVPHLEGRVAEIGAGIGSFSADILAVPRVDRLDLVEPSQPLVDHLGKRFASDPRVAVLSRMCEAWVADAAEASYDCVVMINVLEHIEDDRAALDGIWRALRPGGKLLLFVPAMAFLYSELDRFYGHYRRYELPGLARLAESAGFTMLDSRYFDILGVLPWLILNTWMGKTDFKPGMVKLYDRIGVPLTRALESVVRPPFGKNILLVAQRPVG